MDNPETRTTISTKQKRRKTTAQKITTMNHGPH